MPAAVTDKFRKASSGTRPVVANLAAEKTNGSTTAVLTVATGWNTTTGVDVVIYRTDTSGNIVAGSQTDWIATLAGTTLSGMVLKAGTEPSTGYPAGSQSVVIATPTAAWGDSLMDGILTHADQDGTLKAGAVDVAAVLASNVVTTAKMADGAVTPSKLALSPGTNYVGTSQTTTSVTYADLATVGPAVTANIGTNGLALVTVTCHSFNSAANDSFMSFAVSGSSTVAASDDNARVSSTTSGLQYSTTTLVTGLTAGSNVFTSKYRVASGTGSFLRRTISVVPL